jgi:hypothetical protein
MPRKPKDASSILREMGFRSFNKRLNPRLREGLVTWTEHGQVTLQACNDQQTDATDEESEWHETS